MSAVDLQEHLWAQHGWSMVEGARKERIHQPQRWHAYEHRPANAAGMSWRWQPHQHDPPATHDQAGSP